MNMYLNGDWASNGRTQPVHNPFDGAVVETVRVASEKDVAPAVESAARGAAVMRKTPAYDRYVMLHRAAEILEERKEEFVQTITAEEGKISSEAREKGIQMDTGHSRRCRTRRPGQGAGYPASHPAREPLCPERLRRSHPTTDRSLGPPASGPVQVEPIRAGSEPFGPA